MSSPLPLNPTKKFHKVVDSVVTQIIGINLNKYKDRLPKFRPGNDKRSTELGMSR